MECKRIIIETEQRKRKKKVKNQAVHSTRVHNWIHKGNSYVSNFQTKENKKKIRNRYANERTQHICLKVTMCNTAYKKSG